nr:site-specific integrase [Panacibacter microcysteis]
MKSKEEIKVFAHKPPTDLQRKLIVDKIKTDYYNYYRFICVLYGCTLRPKEITRLKVKHLVRSEQIFRIIPDKEEGNSKTSAQRDVVIPDWLMQMLNDLNLQSCDPDWYIFSGKEGSKMFMPGKSRMHSNSPTRWWRNIVKIELGLDVTQYSLKKLAGNDMVKLQVAHGVQDLLELPKLQMGHSSKSITEVYVDEHKKVLSQIVKTRMPTL